MQQNKKRQTNKTYHRLFSCLPVANYNLGFEKTRSCFVLFIGMLFGKFGCYVKNSSSWPTVDLIVNYHARLNLFGIFPVI